MPIVPLPLHPRFTITCAILPLIATISRAQTSANQALAEQAAELRRQAEQRIQMSEQQRQQNEELRREFYQQWLEQGLSRLQRPAGAESERLFLAPATPPINAPTAYPELTLLPPAQQPQLRESVAESFYLPLHHLAMEYGLVKKHTKAITDYMGRRRDLVASLRVSHSSAAGPAGAAESHLADVRALEAEAESIRHQLTGGSVSPYMTGASFLRGILTSPPKNFPAGLLDAVHATEAACYHDGLSAWQRDALLEIAIELRTQDSQAKSPSRGAKPIFFLPWTARIDTPAGLPSTVQEDLDAFIAAKRKVKDELFATVKAVARRPARTRSAAYQELAVRQESQWVELGTQAEALRRSFQTSGYPAPPAAVPASEELTERVARSLLKKTALQRELTEFVQSLRQLLPRDKIEIVRQGDALAVTRVSGSGSSPLSAAEDEKIKSAIVTTNAHFAQNYAPVAQELIAVRVELDRIVSRLPNGEKTGADALANTLLQTWVARQAWSRYADYRTAVLTPGLTPSERSLLFRAALVDLAPAAEPAPKTG